MISYLKGKILARALGTLIVEIGGLGYEVNLPGYVESQLRDRVIGSEVELYILYHHPEQATRPKLFGFCNQLEREFFEELTRVKDLGPTRALSIFASPVGKMARAIVEGDTEALVRIKGVGPQMAKKIVAELQQRAAKYALLPEVATEPSAAFTLDDVLEDFRTVELVKSAPQAVVIGNLIANN